MMLYDFVAFTKNITSAQAAEMFGMAIRTVQDLRLKVRRGAKDYQLKNVDGSKNLKFLEWKLKQVNAQIKKMECKIRLDAIRHVQDLVAAAVTEFGFVIKTSDIFGNKRNKNKGEEVRI